MKVAVIGAGLSGCTIARLLKDRGHDVSLIEKESFVGGLCITRVNEDGMQYEPFGAHVFHTTNHKVKDFVIKFDKFKNYTHKKGMIINNKLFPFPLTKKAINDLPEKEQIIRELRKRPELIDTSNFEAACISIFGKTLYEYFIKNYSSKMWGIQPDRLSAEWISKRLELREESDKLFPNQWEGLPVHGYSYLIEKMIQGIHVDFNAYLFDPTCFDVVVLSSSIDHCMNHRFGRLQYRSLAFEYQKDAVWEEDSYGTINLPQHPKYIRKSNFKVFWPAASGSNFVQYQEPVMVSDNHKPMYYVHTRENNEIFDKYLMEICKTNICPIGRLGLAKYLDMDKAIAIAFDMIPIVEDYLRLKAVQKYEMIQGVRGKY